MPREFAKESLRKREAQSKLTQALKKQTRDKYFQAKPHLDVNQEKWKIRMVVGHPCTGLLRVEWVMGRMAQIIPCNWSQMDVMQFMSPHIPLQYQVADAENLILKTVIEQEAEWLLFWEHDNIPPGNGLVLLNEYMISKKVPVVGGLYFTRSSPPEPLVYRGVGTGYHGDWKMGDKIWCSGIPFGFTLIHASLLKVMWNDAPEYKVNGHTTRRVFEAPRNTWMDESAGAYVSTGGTSDLAWCQKVVKDKVFERAGWPEYQEMEYPFLIDTDIFVRHIDQLGNQFPLGGVPLRFQKQK